MESASIRRIVKLHAWNIRIIKRYKRENPNIKYVIAIEVKILYVGIFYYGEGIN